MLIILETTHSVWRGCSRFHVDEAGNRVASVVLPFGSLPINAYIYGQRYHVGSDRVSPGYTAARSRHADNT